MRVEWIDPGPNGPIEHSWSDVRVLEFERKLWKYVKGDEPDPRSDEDCIDEFVIVHWATRQEE